MRRINPNRFKVATRGTSREINSRIVLNLVRTHQPISRADLARLMGVRRGAISLIVSDLLDQRLIFEGATGETVRGRKPTFLYIDSRRRAVLAVDIRASESFLMLTDLVGKPLSGVVSIPTLADPKALMPALAARIKRLLAQHPDVDCCEGIGVVVPGMVEHATMRVLHAPTLGWRNVEVREPLMALTGMPVQVENSGRACALAQMWARRADSAAGRGDLVFISVSDGIGVGVIMNGEVLRGRHNIAGEFGHVPLSLDGPRCSCGANGCWEAYISNPATIARYFGRPMHAGLQDARRMRFTIADLIA
jgi:N-acetylglucosamine repressor